MKALPGGHRTAAEGLERYVMYAGGISDGELMVTMLTDLADLFEERAPAGALVRDILGDDPVEFAEDFLANYMEGSWLRKERSRLVDAIARADGEV